MREPNGTRGWRAAWSQSLRRPFTLLVVALTLLSILPIWGFKYFPSQDGPSHVENSYMLSRYFEKDSPYREYYDLNPRPFPNWLSHASLGLLMKVLPPLASEKMLLTAYVILFVLSMLYFVGPQARYLALLAFPFIYNQLLHSGFYNFVISLPLVFVAAGYVWRRGCVLRGWKQVLGLNLLLAAVYFSNILSMTVAVISVVILAGFQHRERAGRALVVVAEMAPAYVLALYYLLTSPVEAAARSGGERALSYLAKIGSLASFDRREDLVGVALAVVFGVLVLWTLFTERLGLGRSGSQEGEQGVAESGTCEGAAARGTSCRGDDVVARQAFLVLAVALTMLCVFAPRRAFGGGVITDRLSMFPLIAVLPWLVRRPPRVLKYAVAAAAIGILVVHLGITAHYYRMLNRGLAEYTSGIGLVERGATILPISFDHKGEAQRIGIYRHAASYYCVARGAINLANYEGDKTYFPLMYKPEVNPFAAMGMVESQRGNLNPERYPGRIDYVLLWSAPPEFPALGWIARNFDLVHAQGRLKLYRNRGLPSE